MNRNFWSTASFMLMTVFFFLPSDGVHAQKHAADQQPDAEARKASALSLVDGIALAFGGQPLPGQPGLRS